MGYIIGSLRTRVFFGICRLWDFIHRKRVYRTLFSLSVLFVFAAIYNLNRKTPLVADDFIYKFIIGDWAPVQNIGDIFKSQYNHYKIWNGRIVLHFLAQLFLLIDKPLFNVINSLGYLALVFLIYFLIKGRALSKENSPSATQNHPKLSLFILINLLLWFFTPYFGQTILWVDGSANYMWGINIILAFLLPFRFYFDDRSLIKDNWKSALFFMAFGFIAGWTNENSALAMIFLILLF